MTSAATADLALAGRVAGPPRPLRVLVAARAAAYLGEADRRGGAVCAVVDHGGVAVPDALVLPPHRAWTAVLASHVRGGRPVLLGGGRLVCGPHEVRVRVAADSRVAGPRAGAPRADVAVRALDRLALRPLVTDPDAVTAHRWTGGRATPAALATDAPVLLGRGPGLTPSGDDLCAGALLVHRVLGTPGTDAAVAALLERAEGRTTTPSVLLLRAAGEGRAAAPVRRAVEALLADDVERAELEAALDGLLALGHTSGADLAAGLRAGLAAVAAHERTTPLPSTERNCA
ncbi:DUF2877 domain-containing protein [Nocardioides sp. ChNu-153]|uniref:oxamate carbamoyltransferase subunit AllH family protein n=1 Tax=unclassified Nocardioides TaxID=2615069 RepID=UPI0024071C8E|nr:MULTISPECIES: DUF2877 domain-containing protein [unclassified Nocardioides]MDF9714629.1 DUF2877 domain-containing protein [Nocardioides sp. ChNu-99]MDN7119837.1 DUF2877 domain-containing protein [Nocardioides sp. ChNu-153]